MNNNDILRRTRYILDLKDNQITKIFKHVNFDAPEKQVNLWLKREDEPGFVPLSDDELILFLDALIIEKRGKKDDSPYEKTEQNLDNNLIITKLKIAFHLKSEEALSVMALAGFKISKHEFSALFRKKDHKHYRACKNQMLRKFMKGMQIKYRGGKQTFTEKTVISDQQPNKKKGQLSLKGKKVDSKSSSETSQQNRKQTVKSDSPESKNTQTNENIWNIPKKPIN